MWYVVIRPSAAGHCRQAWEGLAAAVGIGPSTWLVLGFLMELAADVADKSSQPVFLRCFTHSKHSWIAVLHGGQGLSDLCTVRDRYLLSFPGVRSCYYCVLGTQLCQQCSCRGEVTGSDDLFNEATAAEQHQGDFKKSSLHCAGCLIDDPLLRSGGEHRHQRTVWVWTGQ